MSKKAFVVLDQFKRIATTLVEHYNGKWHKDLGDGALYSFGSALDSSVDIKFHFLNQEKEDLLLLPNRGNEYLSSFSPKFDFVAYTSDESGQSEVYVQPFPPDGNRWIVSSDGGEEPLWSSNGEKYIIGMVTIG